MNRRKFAALSAAALASPVALAHPMQQDTSREIYELRTYNLTFRGNRNALMKYIKEVRSPFLKSAGARNSMIFSELGNQEPAKVWTITSYPDLITFQKAQRHSQQEEILKKSEEYFQSGKTYSRISSSLLEAFVSLPQMKEPITDAELFELRIYEGLNEDAVRRKIKMFDQEELDLFLKVDMNPVFFGKMVIGPYIPSLVYMLNFRDMDHRDKAWGDFLNHPEWDAMRVKPEYAETVSEIRKIFLVKA